MRAESGAVRARTNAKLNLYLRVAGKRRDGFHEIETVFQSVSLADDLRFLFDRSGEVRIEVVPVDGAARLDIPAAGNLVHTALEELGRRSGTRIGAQVEILKRIPVAGGLAGGSANAAGTLLAAARWAEGVTGTTLEAIAADTGSDVAFCLTGGTAIGRGRGEVLERVEQTHPLHGVIGVSTDGLSTAAVYQAYRGEAGAGRVADLLEALAGGDLEAIGGGFRNDLEAGAFVLRPELADRKQLLLDAGASAAIMCGSGPSLFGLARDEAQALEVAQEVTGVFDRVEVVRSAEAGVEWLA